MYIIPSQGFFMRFSPPLEPPENRMKTVSPAPGKAPVAAKFSPEAAVRCSDFFQEKSRSFYEETACCCRAYTILLNSLRSRLMMRFSRREI